MPSERDGHPSAGGRPSTPDAARAAPDGAPLRPPIERSAPPDWPDEHGCFAEFGGRHVPDRLVDPLHELEEAFAASLRDRRFADDFASLSSGFTGRPTPLTRALGLERRLARRADGGEPGAIWIKRDDLAFSGSFAMLPAIGQCLLALRLGKRRVIAAAHPTELPAAVARVAARLGLDCEIHAPAGAFADRPAARGTLLALGARVHEFEPALGSVGGALAAWSAAWREAGIVLGLGVGPHPIPQVVRESMAVVGREVKAQSLRLASKLPAAVVASASHGAEGIFHALIADPKVALVGVERGGGGRESPDQCAPLSWGEIGVHDGARTLVATTPDRESARAGYPAAPPELAAWRQTGRVRYSPVTTSRAREARALVAAAEGLLISIDSAGAIAEALALAPTLGKDDHVVAYVGARASADELIALAARTDAPGANPAHPASM